MINPFRSVRIIGVPMDLGQQRRGVDMGPSALRYAGLGGRLRDLGYRVEDSGNLTVPLAESMPASNESGANARHLEKIAGVCHNVYRYAQNCIEQDAVPIFLGGDHSISIGTVSAMVAHGGTLGVVWIAAHADFNTPETSPSGNVHGMALAALLGRGPAELTNIGRSGPKLAPLNVSIIGVRSIDAEERSALRETGMHVASMRGIDEVGIANVVQEVLAHLNPVDRLHVSLDMDVLDPDEAPGVGTPVHGGLTYREAHLIMEILADSGKVGSLDIVEVNTILDDRNRTAELGVELAASLFGQQIF